MQAAPPSSPVALVNCSPELAAWLGGCIAAVGTVVEIRRAQDLRTQLAAVDAVFIASTRGIDSAIQSLLEDEKPAGHQTVDERAAPRQKTALSATARA